jgi:hypothetical protein
VADRGDGAGQDYFVSGLNNYVSWLTVSSSPGRLQQTSSATPRTVSLAGMNPQDTACLHVQAVDRVQNSTPEQVVCASPLGPPPMPTWPAPQSGVTANPTAPGLVGLDSWFWLAPTPGTITVNEKVGATTYVVSATPRGADWDFGDGSFLRVGDRSGFGTPYPQRSAVTHMFEAFSRPGYVVAASIRYDVTWTARVGALAFGPYPLGTVQLPSAALAYQVLQAEPELIAT